MILFFIGDRIAYKIMKSKIQKILSPFERAVINKLNTPHKIQDFLDQLPFNFETGRETYMSPRRMLEKRKSHCFEGALFAHLCLTYHSYKNFLLDLKVKKSAKDDQDHTVCLFEINGFWGAISKTNHSVLRWRDPIYKDYAEIARTYFHEYFLDDGPPATQAGACEALRAGTKTLDSFSKPFNVFKNFGLQWIVEKADLDPIAEKLDRSPHIAFVPKKNSRLIRKVGKTEIKGAQVTEWRKSQKVI